MQKQFKTGYRVSLVYELPKELPNDLRNYGILENSITWAEA